MRLNVELPRLIRRTRAPHLVMNVLISFGATVLLVRLFLELTGYPRLGNDSLHIAHMLYGGIALAAACLLMVIYASPTAYRIGAILTGVGLGLFFDEVGKFITANNDYFYKPAAPIIYLVALGIAGVYYLLRRRIDKPTDAELLVEALENAEDLLEGRQSEQERIRVNATLNRIEANVSDPDHSRLAHALRAFTESEATSPRNPLISGTINRAESWFLRQFNKHQRAISYGLIGLLAVNSVSSLVTFAIALLLPRISPDLTQQIQSIYASLGLRAFSPFVMSLSNIDLLLDFVTSLITLYGILLFLTGKRLSGLFWVQVALFLDLCVVNVFTFYIEQFSAAGLTLASLFALLCVRLYQHELAQAEINRQRATLYASIAPTVLRVE